MDQSTKVCCACRTEKPIEAFSRKNAARDGRQPRCKDCYKQYHSEWYAKNHEVVREKARAAYRAEPEKFAKRQKAMRDQNPDAWRAAYREHMRRWRAENPEHKERAKEYQREWSSRPESRLRQAANERKRRAKITASAGLTVSQIQARIDYYGGRCWICGATATTIDHVKPLAKGGLHLASNLRPACRSCNIRKHARWWGVERLKELSEAVSSAAT